MSHHIKNVWETLRQFNNEYLLVSDTEVIRCCKPYAWMADERRLITTGFVKSEKSCAAFQLVPHLKLMSRLFARLLKDMAYRREALRTADINPCVHWS